MTELDVKIQFYFRIYEEKVEGILDHLRSLPGVRHLKVLRCVKIKDPDLPKEFIDLVAESVLFFMV